MKKQTLKKLALAAFALGFLVGPRLLHADTPSPPPPPPTPATANPTLELAFSVMDFTLAKPMATRTHSVFVVPNDCGQMSELVADHEDEIKACTRTINNQLELVVEWKTRNALGKPTTSLYAGKQSLAIARGKTYAFGGNRDATLWLQVK